MIEKILKELESSNTTLVAVSKTKPSEKIKEMYDQGQRIFGENRVQEMVDKYEVLPKDIEWHLIGQLQRNKVKYVTPFVSLIHSIDSYRLLKEVNKQALKNERIIPILLQFKIAEEETKAGFDLDKVKEMFSDSNYKELQNIEIKGVMGMATFTDDLNQVREEFRRLKSIFDFLKENRFASQTSFKEISMGMSGDYPIAIAEGSTMVRIGSLLFGSRG